MTMMMLVVIYISNVCDHEQHVTSIENTHGQYRHRFKEIQLHLCVALWCRFFRTKSALKKR